jgi:hypothetical protein
MLRRTILVFAAVAGTWLGGAARGQMGPGGGGFNIDPAMMEQINQMQQMGQQIMTNMQNSGVDPQQLMQDAMQNGNGDPQAMMQSMMQMAVDQGWATKDQINQMQGFMNNMQQTLQNQGMQGFQGQGNAPGGNSLLNNIRRELGVVANEEWAVLMPKIQRVLADLSDVRQNNPTGVSSGVVPTAAIPSNLNAGPGGTMVAGVPYAQETPLAKAWRELQQVLQDVQRPDAEVSVKLATWRRLHEAARSDLKVAQEDLTQYLTLRQEGVLLAMGIL